MANHSVLSFNKQIDGLRCFAVLGVLICHFVPIKNIYLSRFPFGQGVILFFVISGYLITSILLRNKNKIQNNELSNGKALKSFYFRRTIRIFPIYYLTIIFLLLINFQNIKDVWIWLATYTTNIYISNPHNPYIGSFNHLWSLAVEEQFYLIWPFVVLFVPLKYIEKTIIGSILLSLVFKFSYFHSHGPSVALNALTISCADSLGLGALIAYWSIYREALINKLNKFKPAILLSFLPFAYFVIYPRENVLILNIASNFLFSIFSFFVILRASQLKFGSFTKFILENKLVLHLGKISYGVYFYHYFMPDVYNVMTDLYPRFFPAVSPIRIPFLFISAILFAEYSWHLIEKPVLKLKDKFQYN